MMENINSLNNSFIKNDNVLTLKKTDVNVIIKSGSALTYINQYFENNESRVIEAIYTFPLPIDAILLEIIVNLDGKEIRGQITKKIEAVESYEKAIESSDTAVLLEKIDDGLFTLNLGNLLPSQKCKVTIIYSEILHWQGKDLRYVLPTVIAPNYGYFPFESQQEPVNDFMVEYPLTFLLIIEGNLKKSNVTSSSHKIREEIFSENKKITLSQDAFLDRDFILTINKSESNASYAIVHEDVVGYSVIVGFTPYINKNEINNLNNFSKLEGRIVNIVVDCTGSMQGNSINLAKEALSLAIESLNETDYFSILLFGSSYEWLTNGIVKANKSNLITVNRQISHINANLGGTEIFTALEQVFTLKNTSELPQDCFLITDGNIWDNGLALKDICRLFKINNQRIFTVGVGATVSEKLVRKLADKTNGSCEFVSPNELMVNKISRHFSRIFMPVLDDYKINWGSEVLWQSSANQLYIGDSTNIHARLKNKPGQKITIEASSGSRIVFKQSVLVEYSDNVNNDICRQVAYKYIQSIESESERCTVAVEYQLLDESTAFIMIEENNLNQDLPVIRRIPQMMAAGSAGQGITHESSDIRFSRKSAASMEPSVFMCKMKSEESLSRFEIRELSPAEFILEFKKQYSPNNVFSLTVAPTPTVKIR